MVEWSVVVAIALGVFLAQIVYGALTFLHGSTGRHGQGRRRRRVFCRIVLAFCRRERDLVYGGSRQFSRIASVGGWMQS